VGEPAGLPGRRSFGYHGRMVANTTTLGEEALIGGDWAPSDARPLIICDADEVLIEFARPLQAFLAERDLILDLASFALTGNIRRKSDGVALEKSAVRQVLAAYFEARVDDAVPVAGAREAIARLAAHADLVVLSNVPDNLGERRQRALAAAGLAMPLLANRGEKGPAVARLAAERRGPVVFIDDLPPQHASVAEHAGRVHRIHFVADSRLARLIGPAKHSHCRIDDWSACAQYLEDTILAVSRE